jgi:protein-S-isoprenylcysteine O-methyltransferase Ste14
MIVISFSDMGATASRESGKEEDFKMTKRENRIASAVFLPMILTWGYTIFLPLQLDTAWLYTGLTIWLFGMIFTGVAILNFATSPKDKVITKGLYRFTRNPTYTGIILMQTGSGIACASWLYLLLTAALMFLMNTILPSEERYCLYRYGNDYLKYKNKTPRWIGPPKPEKKIIALSS